jgi:hypothetical protein
MPATSRSRGARPLAAVLAACALAAPAAADGTAHAEPIRDSGPGLRATPAPTPVPGPARGRGLVRPEPSREASREARAVLAPARGGGGDAVDWGAAGILAAGTGAALALGVAGIRSASRPPREHAG